MTGKKIVNTLATWAGIAVGATAVITLLGSMSSHWASEEQLDRVEQHVNKVDHVVTYDNDLIMQIAGRLGLNPAPMGPAPAAPDSDGDK